MVIFIPKRIAQATSSGFAGDWSSSESTGQVLISWIPFR
jgi:hypothetical protein